MDPEGSGPAGIEVTDGTGRRVATIPCIERPYMFIEYLRLATSCDLEHPKGRAACGPHAKRARLAGHMRS
jgi:hypothetical protein